MAINDSNDPIIAKKVAEKIVRRTDILGVIGHNSSNATEKAIPVYETADLALISSTSTSTLLNSNVFFRTVPSDEVAGKKLAEYAKSNNQNNALIFYDSEDIYSTSLLEIFKRNYNGTFVHEVDIKDGTQNAEAELRDITNQHQIEVAVLLLGVTKRLLR